MQSLLRTLTFGVVLTLVVSVMSLSAQERDPRIGTWKLNVAQSTYDPGPPPQSITRTYEDRGGGVTFVTVEGINAQGNPIFGQVAHKLDGKDYPLATLGVQTVSDHRTDAFKSSLTPTRWNSSTRGVARSLRPARGRCPKMARH